MSSNDRRVIIALDLDNFVNLAPTRRVKAPAQADGSRFR